MGHVEFHFEWSSTGTDDTGHEFVPHSLCMSGRIGQDIDLINCISVSLSIADRIEILAGT